MNELIKSAVDTAMSVEGLVDRGEVELLVGLVVETLQGGAPNRLVEVGSYCGRTAIAMGYVVKALSSPSKVYAIDAGSMSQDYGFNTLDKLGDNISKIGLDDVIEIIPLWSDRVNWSGTIDLLLIDSNHGYEDAARDLGHFEEFIATGSYVFFHDYHESWPGIVQFVDEIIKSGRYADEGRTGSLKVVRKL